MIGNFQSVRGKHSSKWIRKPYKMCYKWPQNDLGTDKIFSNYFFVISPVETAADISGLPALALDVRIN